MGVLVALRGQVLQYLQSCCRLRKAASLCRPLLVVGYIRNIGVKRGRIALVL